MCRSITVILGFLFVVLVSGEPNNTQKESVKVSIYYEALCPDSVNFITDQLEPAYDLIGDYLTIDFVPYGKATQRKENNTWIFTCQHGPRECYGNKMQACALDQNVGQDNNVEFVNCIMASRMAYSDIAIKVCAARNKLSWKEMMKCSKTIGDDLLAKYGDRTHNLDPIVSFIPTIIFNDKYDSDLQSDALTDFLFTACSQLTEKPKDCPKEANKKYNFWW